VQIKGTHNPLKPIKMIIVTVKEANLTIPGTQATKTGRTTTSSAEIAGAISRTREETLTKNNNTKPSHTRLNLIIIGTRRQTTISKTILETSRTWIELNLRAFSGKFCLRLWVLNFQVTPLNLCKLF